MKKYSEYKDRAKKLAEDHWKYHETLLGAILPEYYNPKSGDSLVKVDALGAWYKSIALHFYMHAVEDVMEGGCFNENGSR